MRVDFYTNEGRNSVSRNFGLDSMKKPEEPRFYEEPLTPTNFTSHLTRSCP